MPTPAATPTAQNNTSTALAALDALAGVVVRFTDVMVAAADEPVVLRNLT